MKTIKIKENTSRTFNVLGKTGVEVSSVGIGTLTVGPFQKNLPIEEGAAVLRYALDCGIRFIDTAQYYQTYPQVRKAIHGLPYDPVISSKSLCENAEEMKSAIEECRKELDREVIDLFLLHEVRGRDDWQRRRGAWDALLEAKAKGLVRACGISTHHVDAALLAVEIPEIEILFPLINYRSLGIRNGDGPGSREEMAAAIEQASHAGVGVFAMKVFGGGNLAGSYQEAIRYVSSLPGVSSMMMGLGSREEVDRAVEVMNGTLSPMYTPEIRHKKMRIDQGDCEGCLACCHRCPNQAIRINENGLAEIDESRCLTCGYCAPVCPVMAIIYL